MVERPINYTTPLSATNVTSADLVVTSGNIETSGGTDVVLGDIEGDAEAEFADPDRGVQEVKGASPSGDLRINTNGEIYVEGHGTVTLKGPYREVSVVEQDISVDASLGVDGSGNLQAQDATGSYSSDVSRVNDGDSTSHDPADGIQSIDSAQIRWRGVTTEETNTVGSIDENKTAYESVDGAKAYQDVSIPQPSGDTFDRIRFIVFHKNHSSTSWNVETAAAIYDNQTETYVYEPASITQDLPATGLEEGEKAADPTETDYTESRYDVDFNIINNEDFVLSDIAFAVWTSSSSEQTTTHKTEDPSVSGDVSASGPSSLDDGEWSSWRTLSGMGTGNNTFNHSINGSQKADFEFEYDFTYEPTAVTLS